MAFCKPQKKTGGKPSVASSRYHLKKLLDIKFSFLQDHLKLFLPNSHGGLPALAIGNGFYKLH